MLTRYIEQLTDIGPDTRSRYLRQAKVTDAALGKPTAADVTDEDVRHWIIGFQRGPKTIHNYHGLLSAGYHWGHGKGLCPANPCHGTRRLRADVGTDEDDDAVNFLTREQYGILLGGFPVAMHPFLNVAVGTGLRFGEITALWPKDFDFTKRTLKVRRAWKKEGDNGERPRGVAMLAKHDKMPGYYLGPPKTPKSRRTIRVSARVCSELQQAMVGLADDDFIFTTIARTPGANGLHWGGGLPWSQANFYARQWKPGVDKAIAAGLGRRVRVHDLRHTFAVWLISGNKDLRGTILKVVQQQLGHESITTTSDRYGGFLPEASDDADAIIDAMLLGKAKRRPLRAV